MTGGGLYDEVFRCQQIAGNITTGGEQFQIIRIHPGEQNIAADGMEQRIATVSCFPY